MANAMIDILCGPSETESPSRKELDQFKQWFLRCHNTLHFVAGLILNHSEMAEHAVENCRQNASRNLPGFASEGEFRGWIVRVLINEGLSRHPEVTNAPSG